MINSKETNPRPDAPASKDQGLEEVRLRQQAIELSRTVQRFHIEVSANAAIQA